MNDAMGIVVMTLAFTAVGIGIIEIATEVISWLM